MSDDKQLHDAANAHKSDLDAGVAAHVSRGDENTPPPKVDAFAARKAMFKKADSLRGGVDTSGGDVDPAMVAAMLAEAGGESMEATHAGPSPAAAPAAAATPATALQVDGEYVTIPIEGGTPIKVAKRDVDREGGATNYLRRRQLDEEQAELARDRAETARLRRELQESQVQQETQRTRSASQDDSAQGGARPASQDLTGPSDQGAALEAKADRLAKMIYEGDAGDAKKAILELLTQQSQSRGNLTEDEILRIVEKRQQNTTTTPVQAIPANPMVDAINKAINDMAAREYADVCDDRVASVATFEKFKQLVALPENRDRRAVDVARDACEWGRQKFTPNPREHIVQEKRGLPPTSTASGMTDTSLDEEEALTPSQVVQQLAERRNFGRRT